MRYSFMFRRALAGLLLTAAAAASWAQDDSEVRNPSGTFIRKWYICGPFPAERLLDDVVDDEGALAPQEAGIQGRAWKEFQTTNDLVDLEQESLCGMTDKAVAFAFAEIESEGEGDVVLGLGSDDSVMAWWNGRQVLVQDVLRGLKFSQDQVHLKMQKGRNTLLLKIYDDGGGWNFAADIRPVGSGAWTWEATLPLSDDELLDLYERKSFEFFWKEANPETGLIADNAPAGNQPNNSACSVASVGFGLTAICIADSRGWITREQALERVRTTLRSMWDLAAHEHGWFYHFIDMSTGKVAWDSEVSSIDTALFLAGALTCRNYFKDGVIADLVNQLYARVEWPWLMDDSKTLSMGWTPGAGFIKYRWNVYSEHMVLYLLGIGAPTNALPPESWYAWQRPAYTYKDMTYVQAVPLFLHQYSHGWVDFRGKRDALADYFQNSVLATKAHRAFCIDLKDKFPLYGENLWGVTASKGPKGYMVWGGPPPTAEYPIDGTVVPCSAGGSVAFTPELTIPVLREIYTKYRDISWDKYGPLDAFNPNTRWSGDGYIGIDVGATLIAIENHRSGNVWKWFMDNEEVEKAMRLAGFKQTARELDRADMNYLRKLARETWDCIAYFVHPDTGLPYDDSSRGKNTSATNLGLYLAALAAARDMGFISAEEAEMRARKVLDGLEQFPTWHGFAQCWHGVADFTPSEDDTWVSLVDSGNYAMGLVAAAQAFPSLRARFQKLVDNMDWAGLYDTNAVQLYGGFDMKKQKFNPDWRVDMLATDSRSAAFMAVASGDTPPELWANLKREVDERYHVKVLTPGWVGGGLFMQYLNGIFLNEKNTLVGRSSANFAYENMRHADALGLPVWGWSASVNPDGGYLGWGVLRDDVVTPHASVLAIEDFPREVVNNLYVLQRMGARAPWVENGQSYNFGFRDSINQVSGKVADAYLVLDQSMLFLSLANFLENGLVRRYFTADPGVQSALKSIPDFANPEGGTNVSIYEPGLGQMKAKAQVGRHLDVPHVSVPPVLDGDLSDWPQQGSDTVRYPDQSEFGVPPMKQRFQGQFHFAWDETNLYVAADVQDDEIVCEAPANELYKDDAIELFVDAQNDGFKWADPKDFQIGLSPSGPDGKAMIYAWFQNTVPEGAEVASRVNPAETGGSYTVEARIPWAFLGITNAVADRVIPFSFAVHTVNKARTASAKINWSYRIEVDRLDLGALKLTP